MTRSFFAALVGAMAIVLGSAASSAQNAYITNNGDNTVSVIATATNTVVGSPIPVGVGPFGVAVTQDGSKVYVTNVGSNTVSVIDTATNTVVGLPITVGRSPTGVAVTPDGSKVYVANNGDNTVSVIDTATDTVVGLPIAVGSMPNGVAVTQDGSKVYVVNSGFPYSISVIDTATNTVVGRPINVGTNPFGAAVTATVTPDGSKVYVAERVGGTVSVIDTATNTAVGLPITVGRAPTGVSVTPDGSKVLVANLGDGTVSVIDTVTSMVVAVLPVGTGPFAFGVFIQPRFAGTPGHRNCHRESVAALAETFDGLHRAAIALGFPTLHGLRTAVNAFCERKLCDRQGEASNESAMEGSNPPPECRAAYNPRAANAASTPAGSSLIR